MKEIKLLLWYACFIPIVIYLPLFLLLLAFAAFLDFAGFEDSAQQVGDWATAPMWYHDQLNKS